MNSRLTAQVGSSRLSNDTGRAFQSALADFGYQPELQFKVIVPEKVDRQTRESLAICCDPAALSMLKFGGDEKSNDRGRYDRTYAVRAWERCNLSQRSSFLARCGRCNRPQRARKEVLGWR